MLLVLGGCGKKPAGETDAGRKAAEQATTAFPATFFPRRHAELSAAACRECHEESFAAWENSHHHLANRPVDLAVDAAAFEPTREVVGPVETFVLEKNGDQLELVTRRGADKPRRYNLEGVIAVDPLRQYLAQLPGGRWQATSVAYDPKEDEWFEVFAGDERLPGEWGHWAGQGMNWNANCAWCHMTDYHKNFKAESDSYHSTWLEQGVSCVQCHQGMEQHVANAGKPGYAGPKTMSPLRIMENCASCHSRRDELVDDSFRPGDIYNQFYSLSLPDQPGLYYPDGQIRDEVFVYGSFMMSSMGHAGITCMDCHDPHTNANILPIANNSLCMRCHSNGLDGATIIEPLAHSHHPAGSTGNLCVECHMPHTTYMQRDPRRDHGFLSPDPFLTQEYGIPNACNNCHTDQTNDWALEWAVRWYGDKLAQKPQRERARVLAAVYADEPGMGEPLLELADKETNAYWRATFTGLMAPYAGEEAVREYLNQALEDNSSVVRARAIRSMASLPDTTPALTRMLKDPSRNVRIEAERAFAARQQPIPNEKAAAEWRNYLEFHADRVDGAFMLADTVMREGDTRQAAQLTRQAVALDPASPEVQRQGAILFSMLGDLPEAEQHLLKALELAPQEAIYHYSLALLYAEQNRLDESVTLLENTVQLDPAFTRAWYNLGLAYTKQQRWAEARAALDRVAAELSTDPGWLQTRAIVERQLRQGATPAPQQP